MGGFFSEIIGRILGRVVVTGMFLGGAHHMAGGGAGMGQGALGQPQSVSATGAAAPAAGAGIGGLFGATQREAVPDFFQVKARVTTVVRECRLMNRHGGKLTRTELLPCERANLLLQRADFANHTLSDQMRVTYIYYAPDGNGVHEGSAVRRPEDAAFLTVGDVLEIKVDRRYPTKSSIL